MHLEWLLILAAAFAATALGIAYLTVSVGSFAVVKRLSGGKKHRAVLISLGILASVFAALSLSLSPVNALVIFLHAALFFALFGLAARLTRARRGGEGHADWQRWLALGVTAVYFAVGYVQCNHVWQKDYALQTEKRLGTLKIALIADSHLGTTFDGDGFAEHLKTIEAQSPDLLVIVGDFVDDWSKRADLLRACEALGESRFRYGVWYAFGNHDAGRFAQRDFTASELTDALQGCGVHVLADEYAEIDGRFILAGRKDGSGGRKDIDELLAGADTDKYIIVLDHVPNDYENEARSPADLVLSGHTHGGQLLPILHAGEWFGLNDRTYGHENRQGTDFIVTSGISDWDIQFKTGTRSEYVIVTVEGN